MVDGAVRFRGEGERQSQKCTLSCVRQGGGSSHQPWSFLGICFFSGSRCEAGVTGRILLEGLKVALDRCDSSRFRVVAVVLLRGGWAIMGMEGKEKRREGRLKRTRKACKATVGTKL